MLKVITGDMLQVITGDMLQVITGDSYIACSRSSPVTSAAGQLPSTNHAMPRPTNFLTPYPQSIPPKKILALKYGDMLSEHYDDLSEADSTCCNHTTKSMQPPPVTNILV